jgi:hypothetical protein
MGRGLEKKAFFLRGRLVFGTRVNAKVKTVKPSD